MRLELLTLDIRYYTLTMVSLKLKHTFSTLLFLFGVRLKRTKTKLTILSKNNYLNIYEIPNQISNIFVVRAIIMMF